MEIKANTTGVPQQPGTEGSTPDATNPLSTAGNGLSNLNGPGRNGQGNAYGHFKHADLQLQAQYIRGHLNFPNPAQLLNGLTNAVNNDAADDATQALYSTAQANNPSPVVNEALLSSVQHYLNGNPKGSELSPQMQAVLDTLISMVGRDVLLNSLNPATGSTVSQSNGNGNIPQNIVTRALDYVNNSLGNVNNLVGNAPALGGQSLNIGGQTIQSAVHEVLTALQLTQHFGHLAQTGGNVVRQAEAMLAQLLYGVTGNNNAQGGLTNSLGLLRGALPENLQQLLPAEVLRDLRAGVFLPLPESYNPFPLTGRARVATEMMEMMRLFDVMDKALLKLRDLPLLQNLGDAAALRRGLTAGGAGLTLAELMNLPSLPGRAGRSEIPELIAALKGILTDAQGRLLVAKDGTPLKLDQLLWLNTAGGFLGSLFEAGLLGTRVSPLLLYGFDALYSVIGFDGRTLSPPHFAAVQAQINGSDFDWVFGQPPLTEGWARALIERLKDSALADHNLLGEMLEEALTDGRFHTVLLTGAVTDGEAVKDSFDITRLLPGAAGDTAYAPA